MEVTTRETRFAAFCFGVGSCLQIFPSTREGDLNRFFTRAGELALKKAMDSFSIDPALAEAGGIIPSPEVLHVLGQKDEALIEDFFEEIEEQNRSLISQMPSLLNLVSVGLATGAALALSSLTALMILALLGYEAVGIVLYVVSMSLIVAAYVYGVNRYRTPYERGEIVPT